MKTCYIYIRTATTEQPRKIVLQMNECQKYAKENDYRVIKIFKDIGYSGIDYKRKALQQLLTDCKKFQVDAVIVFGIDRLSRSFADFQKFRTQLTEKNIMLLSVTQGDLSDAAGGLMGGILVSIAQYEYERTNKK